MQDVEETGGRDSGKVRQLHSEFPQALLVQILVYLWKFISHALCFKFLTFR